MEKHLARLEARKLVVAVYVDPDAAAAAIRWLLACHAAVAAGKACLVPQFGPHLEPSPAKAAALRQLDSIAAKLAQERHP
jgi:hypothetical protein